MKPLIIEVSRVFFYFLFRRPHYPPEHTILGHIFYYIRDVRDQVSHQCKWTAALEFRLVAIHCVFEMSVSNPTIKHKIWLIFRLFMYLLLALLLRRPNTQTSEKWNKRAAAVAGVFVRGNVGSMCGAAHGAVCDDIISMCGAAHGAVWRYYQHVRCCSRCCLWRYYQLIILTECVSYLFLLVNKTIVNSSD